MSAGTILSDKKRFKRHNKAIISGSPSSQWLGANQRRKGPRRFMGEFAIYYVTKVLDDARANKVQMARDYSVVDE
ncbi:hypothetical protein PoB_006789400 [Plakobranchus ocellatus]|uniref:Histone H2A n=1 Tax=Plakobranchus ocellatus TaxID=259542 RepID=A0AAV4DB25_9GAST|nr:hypothetical protein PoB_006789400 [Plakobranchus ocellatus]